jgi:asparagine synthase (glutamine-hydrolysing)
LDKQFVAVAKSISTKLRRPIKNKQIEKHILRTAFLDTGLLPHSVLLRKKEAFSDGVSGLEKSWYQECQERSVEKVGDNWKEFSQIFFQHLTPQTPEAFYYRVLFNEHYGQAEKCAVPYYWMPKWVPGATDPSARTLNL